MHLAIVTPYPPAITGIGQYGYHLSRQLASTGHWQNITVLTGRAAYPPEPLAELAIHPIWQPGSPAAGLHVARTLRRLAPDLVWYNLGASIFGRGPLANLSGFLSVPAVRALGFPVVVTLHELLESADLHALGAPGGPLAKFGARLITRLAASSSVLCVSLRRYVEHLQPRYPRTPIFHIPHGSFTAPCWLPQAAGRELLLFTTHAPFKGLELLLRAYNSLRLQFPDLRLTIAGAEHPRTPGYLQKVRAAFGTQPGVRWLGGIPESELPNLFATATLVVIPYTAATGASSVLYRAAALSRPALLSDLPDLRAAVYEAGLQATFFHSGDVDSLVETAARALADPAVLEAQACHNLQIISQMTLEATGDAYQRAFGLALNPRRAPEPLTEN